MIKFRKSSGVLPKFAVFRTDVDDICSEYHLAISINFKSSCYFYTVLFDIPARFDTPEISIISVIFHIRTRTGFLIFDPECVFTRRPAEVPEGAVRSSRGSGARGSGGTVREHAAGPAEGEN